ncbi:MAG: chemotaxis-specific protein-glutamate methyltransferase CheB [Candidatus Lambdaproteobacteria bacterium]|nr:chemotaxis-specific protein-glutamate methyltransferase CheB [Candidatus Lambdaproteobacteria bacterium]
MDDSALYRRILAKAVDALGEGHQVETAPSGAIALRKIPAFAPDLVLLDIEMPEMSGIETLRAIRKNHPAQTVVLVSGTNSRSADVTIEGLSLGAADFIAKPVGASPEQNIADLMQRFREVFRLRAGRAAAPAGRLAAAHAVAPASVVAPPARRATLRPPRIELVLIGVSTGGPGALQKVIPALPGSLRAPILIVQHMPPLFTASLAKSLDAHGQLRVREAADGQPVERGNVYIAPGGRHMVVARQAAALGTALLIRLDDGPPVNSCRPAADRLFQSAAQAVGRPLLAVVMTGMGQDGLAGVTAVKEQGGYCLTQSEATCVVYGMPMAIDLAGLSDESIALDELAGRIHSLVNGALPA